MTKLSTLFHPTLVGYEPYGEAHNLFHRLFGEREYRIHIRGTRITTFDVEIYQRRDNESFWKLSIEVFMCATVESFYTHLFKHLPDYETEYRAVLNAEYRALIVDDLLTTL